MTGKLTITTTLGHVTGPARIEYNRPWPCPNGRLGVTGRMNGVLMHTMVGNLPGTIAAFNNPSFQASAHFGIAQDGLIHQFGPIGKGWKAWHAMAANMTWYGIEHADDGNPDNPLTDAQLTASAQLVECLSAFAGFPLQVTDEPSGRGYGTHEMGGAAWGGHTCPDLPPHHVRSAQRAEIIKRAHAIRTGSQPPEVPHGRHQVDGTKSLSELAAECHTTPERILWLTANAMPHGWGRLQRAYVHAGAWSARLPEGTIVWLP